MNDSNEVVVVMMMMMMMKYVYVDNCANWQIIVLKTLSRQWR